MGLLVCVMIQTIYDLYTVHRAGGVEHVASGSSGPAQRQHLPTDVPAGAALLGRRMPGF